MDPVIEDLQQDREDNYQNCVKYKISLGLVAFICMVTLLIVLFVAVKTILRYKCRSKCLLLFFLALALSLTSDILFAQYEILAKTGNCSVPADSCLEFTFNWLGFVFFLLAVLANLFNLWLGVVKLKERRTGVYKHTLYISVLLLFFQLIILGAF